MYIGTYVHLQSKGCISLCEMVQPSATAHYSDCSLRLSKAYSATGKGPPLYADPLRSFTASASSMVPRSKDALRAERSLQVATRRERVKLLHGMSRMGWDVHGNQVFAIPLLPTGAESSGDSAAPSAPGNPPTNPEALNPATVEEVLNGLLNAGKQEGDNNNTPDTSPPQQQQQENQPHILWNWGHMPRLYRIHVRPSPMPVPDQEQGDSSSGASGNDASDNSWRMAQLLMNHVLARFVNVSMNCVHMYMRDYCRQA